MNTRLIAELRFMLRNPIEQKLPQVTAPTMLIRGENDPLVPQGWFEEVARLVNARQTSVIPRWGHAVNHSAARQLVDEISPFLMDRLA